MAKYRTKNPGPNSESASRPRETAHKAAHAAAIETLEQEGFAFPKRPGDDLAILPEDITTLGDRELMVIMREQLAWIEYSGYRLARGEIIERELDMQIGQRTAWLLFSRWGGEGTDRVAIAKAEAENDREIIKLREEHMKAMAYRKLVGNLYEAAERRINLVSRELTRRTSIEPAFRRAHKHGGA